jgi:hypothetical protein
MEGGEKREKSKCRQKKRRREGKRETEKQG